MHDIILCVVTLIIGTVLGAFGAVILTRGSNASAIELMKSQNALAIEAAKSAFTENAAKSSRNERDDFLNLAKSQMSPMVDPIKQGLDELRNYITSVDRGNATTAANLLSGIEQVLKQSQSLNEASNLISNKTDALVGALRGSQVRGRWGEIKLRNIIESAGMSDWCDFSEQTSAATNGEGRPDITVRLPGQRFVFVDSKVPMISYEEAQDAGDERQTAALRREHARSVKAHVDELARRGYHRAENSMPFTVMFMPTEPLLFMAMSEMPELWEYAKGKGVMIASPMILMALLSAFANGWREQKQDEQAREMAKMGSELYRRLAKFAGIFNQIGQTIATLNTRYNEAAGSFSARLMPQAQRVHKAAALADEEITEPVMVDAAPRQLALEVIE